MNVQPSVPKQRGIIESGGSKQAIKIMPSRHEDRIGGQDGCSWGRGRTTNGIKIEQARPILPHARAGKRVDGVRLDRGGVLVSTRRFLGRGMLCVYGDLGLRVRWYR
jgi:hypothetical protein